MNADHLTDKAASYMTQLCVQIANRRVGSPGNQVATARFAEWMALAGFQINRSTFRCLDWRDSGAELVVAGTPYRVYPSPYSLGCHVYASLVVATTIDELAAVDAARQILLLRGDLTKEQLMPKKFPFYNPERHQRIIGLLETQRPVALITATGRDVQMVGDIYPFPLIEDGDFDIPSVYMTEEDGARLASLAGQETELVSHAVRIPSYGENVVARRGPGQPRVVCFAHIDTRMGTPGASDNASGVTVLALLAELLADYDGPLGIELVAMNGEDYYANPGELDYLARNAGRFDEIALGINIDDVGYRDGKVAYSLYEVPDHLTGSVEAAFAAYPDLVAGEPWYAGDHGLLLANGTPTVALTSDQVWELMRTITHTPKDTIDLVDPRQLAQTAQALCDLFLDIAHHT